MPDNRFIAEAAEPGACPILMSDDLPCGRPILDPKYDEDEIPVCLMHSQNSDKDNLAFQQEIEAITNEISQNHRPEDTYDFSGFVFPESHYSGITYAHKVIFNGAMFKRSTTFRDSVFTQGARFINTTFEQNVDFFNSTFRQRADFSIATFNQFAGFHVVEFTKEASFD